jgi:hypothetical protein
MIAAAEEHEFEAAHGLPESLPQGENILWQGSPDWRTLAIEAFHLRKLTVYFAVILGLRAANVLLEGGSAWAALESALWLTPLAIAALGMLAAIAWLTARTAVYTITNRRLVMRVGIVLSVTFNIPFLLIQSAGLRSLKNGAGDIPISLASADQIAYFQLWPHARPWRLKRTEPMLRAVPAAAEVAAVLAQALKAASEAASSAAPRIAAADQTHPSVSQRTLSPAL